jgi:hypothetical protein
MIWPLVLLTTIYAILTMFLAVLHDRAAKDWARERVQLLDRIMAINYQQFQTWEQAKVEPTEEELAAANERKEVILTYMDQQFSKGDADIGAE